MQPSTLRQTTADDDPARRLRAAKARGEQWLLRSGIYILDQSDPHYGAVYSHYDRSQRRYDLVYAEATGYALSLLAHLGSVQGDEAYAATSKASGDWLSAWSERHQGVIAMGVRDGTVIRQAYAFDNGVCCKGLLDLYQTSRDVRYLNCATRIADWLIREAVNGDGSVKPILDFESGRFVEDRTIWYKVSGSFQAKIAMPLLLLHAMTGDTRARETAIRVCRWAIKQQRRDGGFPANMHTSAVNVHFHCYTVEALLYAYAFEGTPELLGAAKRGIDWAIRMQRADGRIPAWCGGRLFGGRVSDAQAQTTRLFSVMHMLEPSPQLVRATRKASAALLSMQRTAPDAREDGGFSEGLFSVYRMIPKESPRMTSWATMFALQALHLAGRHEAGAFASASRWLF